MEEQYKELDTIDHELLRRFIQQNSLINQQQQITGIEEEEEVAQSQPFTEQSSFPLQEMQASADVGHE